MNKTYYEVDIRIMLPVSADPEIAIRTLGQYFRIDRVAYPIENEPLFLFLKEIERPKEEGPEEIVDLGSKLPKEHIINKVIKKVV